MDTDPPLRFVTASLHVDYLKPTPIGVPLEVRGRVQQIKDRKVVVEASLSAARVAWRCKGEASRRRTPWVSHPSAGSCVG